jgi:SAM-dependent methyltransferase
LTVSDLQPNYEQLSDLYDEDRRRWQVPRDDNIASLPTDAAVLDLACGTGTYLCAQAEAFPEARLFGADPSPGMLEHAVRKVPSVRFSRARAEALPFADAAFAYVRSGYAFHQFVGKDAALAEVVRVLGPHGRFRIDNIEPYSLKGWWVFRFFDGTYENDMQRFWPPERIAAALEALGCDVDVSVEVRDVEIPVAEVRADAERRVISQLAVLDDERYAAGLARLHALDDDAIVDSQGGSLTLIARKR